KMAQALSYLERAIALREQIGNIDQSVNALISFAASYQYQKKWTEAVHCYKRILDIQKRKSDGRPDQIAQAICDCGNALYELYKVALKDRSALRNILDETIELYTQALALYENLG